MLPRCDASARLRVAFLSHGEMRSIEGGLSAVFDGDVGEAVGETGAEMRGGEVVEGDGVAAGVGPDDADGGGAGLDEGGECELGEGDVGLEVGVAVVGGGRCVRLRPGGSTRQRRRLWLPRCRPRPGSW